MFKTFMTPCWIATILIGLQGVPAMAGDCCDAGCHEEELFVLVLFSDDEFDATQIDEESLLLADPELEAWGGLPVAPVGGFIEDVSGNGRDDLVVFLQRR